MRFPQPEPIVQRKSLFLSQSAPVAPVAAPSASAALPFGGKKAPPFAKGAANAGTRKRKRRGIASIRATTVTAGEQKMEAARRKSGAPKSAAERRLERARGVNPKKGD